MTGLCTGSYWCRVTLKMFRKSKSRWKMVSLLVFFWKEQQLSLHDQTMVTYIWLKWMHNLHKNIKSKLKRPVFVCLWPSWTLFWMWFFIYSHTACWFQCSLKINMQRFSIYFFGLSLRILMWILYLILFFLKKTLCWKGILQIPMLIFKVGKVRWSWMLLRSFVLKKKKSFKLCIVFVNY